MREFFFILLYLCSLASYARRCSYTCNVWWGTGEGGGKPKPTPLRALTLALALYSSHLRKGASVCVIKPKNTNTELRNFAHQLVTLRKATLDVLMGYVRCHPAPLRSSFSRHFSYPDLGCKLYFIDTPNIAYTDALQAYIPCILSSTPPILVFSSLYFFSPLRGEGVFFYTREAL